MIDIVKQKYKNLVSDKKFSEIITGSIWTLAAKILGSTLTLLISIIVARKYGADMIGILSFVQAFIAIISLFAMLGTNVAILRLIPEHITKHSATSAFHVYRKTQYFVVTMSLLVGGGFYFVSSFMAQKVFSKPHLSFYIALASLCLILKTLTDFNTLATRALRLVKSFAFMQVMPQATMLFILLGMIVIAPWEKNAPVYAQLTAWGITALLGLFIMNRAFHLRMKPYVAIKHLQMRHILNISMPMLMISSMSIVIGQTGILILGKYYSPSAVGYYAIAVKIATLTSFILQAINSMAAPKFSELYYSDRIDELFYVAKKSTKLIFWSTTPIMLLLVMLGQPVLAFFGKDFIIAYPAMLIFMIGQFVSSISGSTSYFMNMTGDQKALRNIMVVATLMNIVLNFTLIPRFGINGAAVSGAMSIVVWNIAVLFFIKKKYGQTIGYLPFL